METIRLIIYAHEFAIVMKCHDIGHIDVPITLNNLLNRSTQIVLKAMDKVSRVHDNIKFAEQR